jgi:hypothetical protein
MAMVVPTETSLAFSIMKSFSKLGHCFETNFNIQQQSLTFQAIADFLGARAWRTFEEFKERPPNPLA